MIMEWFKTYSELTRDNPWVGMLAVPIIGYIGYTARTVPSKIWRFIKSRLLITISMNDSVVYNNTTDICDNMFKWYATTKCAKLVKSFKVSPSDSKLIVPGGGTHLMVFNRWLYFVNIVECETKTTYGTPTYNRITITTIGRNQDRIKSLIHEFQPNFDPEKIAITRVDRDGDPTSNVYTDAVALSDMCIPMDLKNKIKQSVNTTIFGDREWFKSRGLAQKMTMLLHGEPGTGKTSIVRGVAKEYGMRVHNIDLSIMTNRTFANAVANMEPNSIMLIEDIDASTNSVASRDSGGPVMAEKENVPRLTLSGVLNTLDGIAAIDRKLIIITTNYPDRLDPALIRRGRIDTNIRVGRLGKAEVDAYMKRMYPDVADPMDHNVTAIRGCDLHGCFMDNMRDYDAFITALREFE